jgi:hypothetical protein
VEELEGEGEGLAGIEGSGVGDCGGRGDGVGGVVERGALRERGGGEGEAADGALGDVLDGDGQFPETS